MSRLLIPFLGRRIKSASVSDGTVSFGRNRDVAFVTIVALAIPYVASVPLALFAPLTAAIDAPGYWALQTIHQLLAAALALGAIRLVSTRPFADWGLNLRNPGRGLFYAALFALAVTGVGWLLLQQAPPPPAGSALSNATVAAILLTHFLVIGTTQEILFRGFVMGFLQRHWGKSGRLGAKFIPASGVIAALIFTLSHVRPFPPYVWPAQLLIAFSYGLAYAFMYHRTQSLLGSSLGHGFSNAIYVALMMVRAT